MCRPLLGHNKLTTIGPLYIVYVYVTYWAITYVSIQIMMTSIAAVYTVCSKDAITMGVGRSACLGCHTTQRAPALAYPCS